MSECDYESAPNKVPTDIVQILFLVFLSRYFVISSLTTKCHI